MKRINLEHGQLAFARQPAEISATVDHSVVVAVWDRTQRKGGACHFHLPSISEVPSDATNDYGNYALTNLLRQCKAAGSRSQDLVFKMVGGADSSPSDTEENIGAANVQSAREMLNKFGFKVEAASVGGHRDKKLQFNTTTGRLRVRSDELKSSEDQDAAGKAMILCPPEKCERSLVVIGASTGGTDAVRTVLTSFGPTIPPIVITIHIAENFSRDYADRLNSICRFSVKEATDGAPVTPGTVYIAPGGRHMKLIQLGDRINIRLTDDPPVNRFKPSVDYLYESVLDIKGRHIVPVLLTGMGEDGAAGLLKLNKRGITTIVQDEKTCVVYGMPKAAVDLGAADKVLPLKSIAPAICGQLRA